MLKNPLSPQRQGTRLATRGMIEEPRGKPRGIFDRKEFYLFLIRSLTPQQAAENALAIAVQPDQNCGFLC
jgi:hypothetical protein